MKTFSLLALVLYLLLKTTKSETCNFTSNMFRSGLMEDIKELVKQEVLRQRYIGESSQYAALSCGEILNIKPCQESGFYWILDESSGNRQRSFCKIGQDNPLTLVTSIDMKKNTSCPGGLELVYSSHKRFCRNPNAGNNCYSIVFPVHGKEYSYVKGKVIGYQYGGINSFSSSSDSIDGVYVDGISITHGQNPRNHIWTYAVADRLSRIDKSSCPCFYSSFNPTWIPSFVGNDYYCDIGTHGSSAPSGLVLSNALWDGENCAPSTTCCDNPNLPWFERELPNPTTDDIELRICRDNGNTEEDVYLEVIELYIA